jgi:plastocyanin
MAAIDNTVYMGKKPDGTDIGHRFYAEVLTVAAGTTVHWNNTDYDDNHTATSEYTIERHDGNI